MENYLALTVSDSAQEAYGERVQKTVLNHIVEVKNDTRYAEPEASIRLPFDESILKSVLAVCAPLGKEETSGVVVIGVGGSNLGTRAIYEALRTPETPNFFFLDTCHPTLFLDYKEFLTKRDPKKVVYFEVSKSGTTTETTLLASWTREYLEEKGWLVPERWITIAPHGELSIPEKVGGRYSVFSGAHLAPLYFMLGASGLEHLLTGAREALDNLAPATISAEVLYGMEQYGYTVHDTFFFHPRLATLGAWYRQLFAESLGKEGKGLLPTVSMGTVDLHSMAQMYFDGKRNVITSFVTIRDGGDATFDAITEGVLRSYSKHNLPYLSWKLARVDAVTLGAFMQAKMIEVMLLATLLGVNAFDQPAVELYKAEVRALLPKTQK